MPLIGDQQDEDRIQIADLVVSKMNQAVPHTSSSSAVRAMAGQPAQVLEPETLNNPNSNLPPPFAICYIILSTHSIVQNNRRHQN